MSVNGWLDNRILDECASITHDISHPSSIPQTSDIQESEPLPMQQSWVTTIIHPLSSGIHPLLSSPWQVSNSPLQVQAVHSQTQTITLFNQRPHQPAPHTSQGQPVPKLLLMPPISCTTSRTSTCVCEELSHCVGHEMARCLLFFFDKSNRVPIDRLVSIMMYSNAITWPITITARPPHTI